MLLAFHESAQHQQEYAAAHCSCAVDRTTVQATADGMLLAADRITSDSAAACSITCSLRAPLPCDATSQQQS